MKPQHTTDPLQSLIQLLLTGAAIGVFFLSIYLAAIALTPIVSTIKTAFSFSDQQLLLSILY